MQKLWKKSRKLVMALTLAAVLLGGVGVATGGKLLPTAHASAQYIQCSTLYTTGWVAGPTYYFGSESGQPYIQVWMDGQNHSIMCQQQAKAYFTASSCQSGRTIDVYVVDGTGYQSGDNVQQVKCGTSLYFSNIAYSGDCRQSGRFNANQEVGWVDGLYC